MATTKSQRAIIWVMAILMMFGSVGFYFLIILENGQAAQEQAELQEQLANQPEPEPAQALPGYEAEPFEAENVSELVVKDLQEGDGETVPEGAAIRVNYMGWLPDGMIFDSTNRGGTEPIVLQLNGVIEGWKEGIPGMKVGGVRQLTIPAAQAYGEQGSPPSIPPNTPLRFIIEVVGIEE